MPRRLRRLSASRAGLACAVIAAAVPVAACDVVTASPICSTPGPESRADSFKATAPMVTLPYGLRYGELSVGCGAVVKPGDQVTAEYTGWLQDGNEFDSTRGPGRQPFVFIVGQQQAIPGVDSGVVAMHVGGTRRLEIPPSMAYGSQGVPPTIPANSTLVVDIEVLSATATGQ